MRKRTTSYVIAYLLLLAVAFVADAILLNVFIGYLGRETYQIPSITRQIGSGLVYGAYGISPYYVKVPQGGPNRNDYVIVVTTGLHIVLVNPNPVVTDVVLLGYYPQSSVSHKVLDMISTFGIEWDNGNPPKGVKIIHPTWFQSIDVDYAIRMPPHAVVSFTIPSFFGVPEKILACTKIGCVKLETAGEQLNNPTGSEPWIIFPQQGNETKPNPSVSETWEWRAFSIAGPSSLCVRYLSEQTSVVCGYRVVCCVDCPSGCVPRGDAGGRGTCDYNRGVLTSYSLKMGAPVNVIYAYYVSDPGFDFATPKEIRVGGYTYTLYGFNSSSTPHPQDIPHGWFDYRHQGCFHRNITVKIRLKPYLQYRETTFEAIWGRSSKIFVYIAAKGYDGWPLGLHERDIITINISYIDKSGALNNLGVLTADNGFKDNSAELESDPEKWSMPIEAKEIIITITYHVEGPSGPLEEPLCFTNVYDLYTYCGVDHPDRKMRFAFYVELIPSEYLAYSET